MGGLGSGRRRREDTVYVEECTRFGMDELVTSGLLEGSAGESRRIDSPSSPRAGSISLLHRGESKAALELRLPARVEDDGSPEGCTSFLLTVEKSASRRRDGGWAFRCPRPLDDEPCGRRVTALYLPPGASSLGCRHCYGLKYRSTSWSSSKKVRAYVNDPAQLLSDFGRALVDIKLGREDPRQLGVLCQALGEFKQANPDVLIFLRQS